MTDQKTGAELFDLAAYRAGRGLIAPARPWFEEQPPVGWRRGDRVRRADGVDGTIQGWRRERTQTGHRLMLAVYFPDKTLVVDATDVTPLTGAAQAAGQDAAADDQEVAADDQEVAAGRTPFASPPPVLMGDPPC